MRASRRSLPRQFSRIIYFLALLLSIACATCTSRAQSGGTPAPLPQKWDEPVRALGANISGAASPARMISLEVKNISSLRAADAAAIREGLEAELVRRGFHIVAASSSAAEARVETTLSESAEKYVWVAEIRSNDAERMTMVDVARPAVDLSGKRSDSLVLDRKLAWQQPGRFLDFAGFQGFDAASATLWVLEPERIAFYRNAGGEWQWEGAAAIAHRAPWPRDLRGTIDAAHARILLPGIECTVKSAAAKEVECTPAQELDAQQIKVEGREGDDTLALRSACGAAGVVLATGMGDWTQPDSIQGYLEKDGHAASSGDPIQTDGPVTALNWDAEGAARAVVHDLKSGNYEAYIVTATCGH
jgi:hypothetical protein